MLSLMFMSATCSSSDDDEILNNASEISTIKSRATSGTWKVTYYYDTDHEETSNFTGYTFTFSTSGVLTATNGVNTYTGSWSVSDDSSSSSSSSSSDNHIEFRVSFSSPNNFESLSEDWEITSHSASKIVLTHVSGGNGGTDFLTFEKS